MIMPLKYNRKLNLMIRFKTGLESHVSSCINSYNRESKRSSLNLMPSRSDESQIARFVYEIINTDETRVSCQMSYTCIHQSVADNPEIIIIIIIVIIIIRQLQKPYISVCSIFANSPDASRVCMACIFC